ncbi:OmpH family outer membrane protein [Candidatus Pelagibacter sp.]|jgi:outer membrane protein|nr:OmpH family outer membrane protein [Candidatus Pelagibacter sp.]
MKNIFLSLLFVFLFLINPVNSDEKISFIDMDKVISTSNPGLSILKQLKNINNKNSTILNKEENQLKEKEKKLITQKNIISEADFQNKVNELKSEVNMYNINRNKMIEKFNQLKVENTNNLLKLINPILTKYSNKNKISIILQKKNLIIGKSELDITDEIIKIINNEITDFKIK